MISPRRGWSKTTKDRLLRSAYTGYLREVRGHIHASMCGQAPTENLRIALAMTRQLESYLTAQIKADERGKRRSELQNGAHTNMILCNARLRTAANEMRRALALSLESSDVAWRPGQDEANPILYRLPTLRRMEDLAAHLGHIPCLSTWFSG